LTDAKHSGSLSTLTSDDKLEEVRATSLEDRRVTIAESAQKLKG
jgi:hypothetical protein